MRLACLMLSLTALCGCRAVEAVFSCSSDTQCIVENMNGYCERDTGYCSVPDSECGTRRRYDRSAPAGLAGNCTGGSGDDLGISDGLSAVGELGDAAAPLLMGTVALQNGVEHAPPGRASASHYLAQRAGTATHLSVYVHGSSLATQIRVGIYDHEPGMTARNLLGAGIIDAPMPGGFNTTTLAPPVALTAGTDYWIAILAPVGSGEVVYLSCISPGCTPLDLSQLSASTTLSELPAVWAPGDAFPDGSPITAYVQ